MSSLKTATPPVGLSARASPLPSAAAPAAVAPAAAAAPASAKTAAAGTAAGKKGAAAEKKPPKIKKSVLAEQERLVAEAAAAHAAEQARLEEVRRKAAEAAAKAAAEAQAAAEEEAARLHAQAAYDSAFLAERASDVARLDAAVYEKTSWDKYLECNPLPDVAQESSLNTYLSMWREHDDEINAPMARYRQLIDSCSTTERVVDLLEEVHAEAREELQIRKSAWCTSFISLLRNLTAEKLDTLTAQFLAKYDEFESHETRVMNVAHNTPDLAFGLWSHNTSKRTDGASVREKKIDFPAILFNIELPAALQKSRTSIRVIRTLYDHTSLGGEHVGSAINKHIRRAGGSATGAGGSFTDPPEMPPFEKDLAELSAQADELYAASIAAQNEALASAGATGAGGAAAHPPPVHFVSVGGIINIEQLALPPPPKKAKGWVMRDITPLSKAIQVVPYPAASDESAANQSPAAVAAASAAGGALSGGTSQAPLRVSFLLPGYVFLDDREPHFGWWDARHSCWRQEGVSVETYEPKTEGGMVKLSLQLLKPVAIIQSRALDFPYRSWHLKPVHTTSSLPALQAAQPLSSSGSGPDGSANGAAAPPSLQSLAASHAHMYELQLQGSRFPVELELAADHARLIHPIHPVLNECNSQQMLPGILLNRMARAGINIQPTVEDAAYCRKPWKSLLLTAALHEHLALVAGVFEIAGSPFNSSRDQRKCVFRVKFMRESLVLAAAAEKRKRLDEEARGVAEALRAKEAAAAGGAAKKEDAASAKDAAMMAAMIAQMEADSADPAAEAAAAAARAAAEAAAAEAARSAQDTAEEIAAATAKRYALADEWYSVLVELAHIEKPKPKVQVQLFSQNRDAVPGSEPSASKPTSTAQSPQASRPATAAAGAEAAAATAVAEAASAAAAAAEPAPGTVAEDIPGGAELLKFTLIRGAGADGLCDERPLPDCVSHFSLRRCLLAYFIHLTPMDLATALDVQLPVRPALPPSLNFLAQGREAAAGGGAGAPPGSAGAAPSAVSSPLTSPTGAQTAAAAGGAAGTAGAQTSAAPALTADQSLPNPSFLLADVHTLQFQQTLRRVLNLTHVFTFH